MKIADITAGQRYVDLGNGRLDIDDPSDVVRAGAPCTVISIEGAGRVRVQYRKDGPIQSIRAMRLQPLSLYTKAVAEVTARHKRDSERFDERLAELEEARLRILGHLNRAAALGIEVPYTAYDLSPDVLAKPVKAHSDRSGYWTGTGIRLDYVQIARLLDAVTNAKGA